MSTSNTRLSLAPQVALVSSVISYPLLFYLVTPRNATASRFTKSREAISVLHCTFVALASAYVLQRRRKDWDSDSTLSFPAEINKPASRSNIKFTESLAGNASAISLNYGVNSQLITTRSNAGNSITAFEMGYLVQDAVILVLAARLRARDAGGGGKSLAKEINWRVLGWHHAGLSSALGVLQWYIAQGKEKGIMIILMLMLMNASTPAGTLNWYLVKFQPSRRKAIVIANVVYLLMYGIFRVGIIPYILHVFGSQIGLSEVEAFMGLRTSCRLGTATIGIANSVGFIIGVRKFFRRCLRNATGRKGI